METVLNLWQLVYQHDLVAQTKKRRQLWIDQAKASISGSPVAIVTGKVFFSLGFKEKIGKKRVLFIFNRMLTNISWMAPS